MSNYVQKLVIGGQEYLVKDAETRTKLDALVGGTLATETAGETYWVPTSTIRERIDAILNAPIISLKGTVSSKDELPTDAKTGDLYLVPASLGSGEDRTAEWLKTEDGWQLLGVLDTDIEEAMKNKVDRTELAGYLNLFGVKQIGEEEYELYMPADFRLGDYGESLEYSGGL